MTTAKVAADDSGVPHGPLRDFVQRQGWLTATRNVRAVLRRDVTRWVKKGCPSPAPNVVKFSIVRANIEKRGIKVFIETGTYLGSMVDHIASVGAQCFTIEIAPDIYRRARHILARRKNVELLLGDSATELPKLLRDLQQPAAFWLDGHYSGSFTSKGEDDTPISVELDQVLNHPVKNHVIMIDDARHFVGENGYPNLSDLLGRFDNHPHYKATVTADIIIIDPR